MEKTHTDAKKPIRGVIFDVDGTLLDSMPMWDHAGERYLLTLGVKAEEDLADRMFTMTFEDSAEYIRVRYGLDRTREEVEDGMRAVVGGFYRDEAALKPGAGKLLSLLREKGVPMAVATSTPREHVEAAFRRLGIMDCFRAIFTCSEIGVSKNEPVIFLRACESLRTEPGETAVFEDGLYAIRTAVKAGFQTVGLNDPSSRRDQDDIRALADHYYRSIGDAAELFL